MSESFNKILVKDDRIGGITDKVDFAVLKAGSNVTAQPHKAVLRRTPLTFSTQRFHPLKQSLVVKFYGNVRLL